jgi:hypothetical protein
MAVKKIGQYETFSLSWLSNKALELKEYVDARPLNLLADRIAYKETKTGGVIPVVIATIEQQRADLSKAVKDYGDISMQIKKLMEEERLKVIETRGDVEIPDIMR